jgi:hypothetical protein
VPIKEDTVDYALSDFINQREKPLEVPFCREQSGVYLFGTKRVFIKVENGKIIIRVGGGFMQIDEFVELYTPLELEKWEMKQMENSSRSRLVMGKLAGSMVDTRTISPSKATRIIHKAFEKGGGSSYSTFFAVPRRSTNSPSPPR